MMNESRFSTFIDLVSGFLKTETTATTTTTTTTTTTMIPEG